MTSIDQNPRVRTLSYSCIKNNLAFGLFTVFIMLFSITLAYASEAQQSGEEVKKWNFYSGPLQNQMVELFTSEGCSSCPPADRWLSNLKDSPDLWRNIIPIAFHVDYWNNLGWADPFSSRAHSLRQRIYRDQRYVNSVYTPGFVVNGSEWRGWFNRQSLPKETHENVGNLSLDISNDGKKTVFHAEFLRPGPPNSKTYRSTLSAKLSLNVAVLAMNQKTDVELGENRGKTLHHDFVVTNIQSVDLTEPSIVDEGNPPLNWSGELDLSQCQDCAISAWISAEGDQQPIQATGGYLK